jgi:hypothetical protein
MQILTFTKCKEDRYVFSKENYCDTDYVATGI